jgi:hypothetical protein
VTHCDATMVLDARCRPLGSGLELPHFSRFKTWPHGERGLQPRIA